jgi:nitrite reductase/ring-hydroxylating ferredoxin subunit
MKNKLSLIFLPILLIFSSLFVMKSCRNREETVECFPYTNISVILNLNLPSYFDLQTIGWIYTNEQSDGTRGLVVVRTPFGGFKIYDRNAPHLCPAGDTTLVVEDNLYLVCPKDNSRWLLTTGEPMQGNPTGYLPKTYPYSYDSSSNVLTVYN